MKVQVFIRKLVVTGAAYRRAPTGNCDTKSCSGEKIDGTLNGPPCGIAARSRSFVWSR